MKVAELIGVELDWAVSKCANEKVVIGDITSCNKVIGKCLMWPGHSDGFGTLCYEPSVDWSQGGSIIEREKITLNYGIGSKGNLWFAEKHQFYAMDCNTRSQQYGQTPLIAAMRCFVESRLGDEIEIPKEFHE